MEKKTTHSISRHREQVSEDGQSVPRGTRFDIHPGVAVLGIGDDDGVEGAAGHEGEDEAAQGFHLAGADGGDEEDGDGGEELGGGFELFFGRGGELYILYCIIVRGVEMGLV